MTSHLTLRQINAVHCGVTGLGTSHLTHLPVDHADPSTQGYSLQNYVKFLTHKTGILQDKAVITLVIPFCSMSLPKLYKFILISGLIL